MGRANKKSGQTVVLVNTVTTYSAATVNLAVHLAASVDTRLQGLFVEDEDLLQITNLPCTREITLTTARERPTSAEQLQRSLRSLAEQFRRALEREAGAAQVGWSFATIRGRLPDLGRAAQATYTVFEQAIPRLLTTRLDLVRRKVLLIADHTPDQLHALRVVLGHFADKRVEITLVRETEQVAADIERLIVETERDITLREVDRGDLLACLTREGTGFACAIVSQSETDEDLSRILSFLRCPIVLVAGTPAVIRKNKPNPSA